MADGTPAELLGQIREIAAEALDIDSADIADDDDLFERHGLDSIGILMIHIELAMHFGYSEPANREDLSECRSVRALAAYVAARAAGVDSE